ncbi:MAG: DUF1576 domain-containing protein [Treponema sp.]|nr:DUF1576 domain-containing protein [Treponema sp.]
MKKMSNSQRNSVSENKKFLVFAALGLFLIVFGFYFSPSFEQLISGYLIILSHPSLLEFDSFAHVGHFGSSFLNSGLLLLCVLLVYKLTNTKLQGGQIAAAMMVVGFAFYGKNPVNVWFPVIGVLGYAAWQKRPLSTATATAFFSTTLSPVFSVLAFGTPSLQPFSPQAYFLGAFFGIFGGILVGFLADILPNMHRGYILFNTGYAAGFAGIFITALLRAFNLGHDQFPYQASDFVSGANLTLSAALIIMFLYLIVAGFILGGGSEIGKMIWFRSKGGSYVEKFGFAPCLINMGILGIISTAYVFLVGGQINGCIFACIWTAAGFASNGLTVRTFLPAMAGVFIAAFITGGVAGMVAGNGFLDPALAKVAARSMILAAVFSCGIAPVAGEHGMFAGLFVGAAHSILVTNTSAFHTWMSLYNNGLSLGIIATLLYPIYSRWGIRKGTASSASP